MASHSLLNVHVDQGKATLSALDAAGFDIRAAFWVLDDDTQRWRFTVAGPNIDVLGTLAVYQRMIPALTGRSDVVPLQEIYLISPEDELVSGASRSVSTPPAAISAIPLMGTRMPDMYIYRMYRAPLARAAP